MRATASIEEGQVWHVTGLKYNTNGAPIRRVLLVRDGRVIYSRSGDGVHNCLVKTFKRWIARGAKLWS